MQSIKQQSGKVSEPDKKSMSGVTGFTLGVLVCGLIVIGVLLWSSRVSPKDETANVGDSRDARVSAPPQSSRKSVSREHLDQAKAALQYGSIRTARSHLEKIAPNDEKYAEAQKILDELEVRPTTDRDELDARRERYGEKLKERFQSQGIRVSVNVAMSTLFINYQPTDREHVYKAVANMNLVPDLKRYGFVSYVLTDGEQEDIRSLK